MVAVDLEGKGGKVPHHEVEDLVDDIRIQIVEFCLFQDELAVDHDGEHLAQRQGEGRIHILDLVRTAFSSISLKMSICLMKVATFGKFLLASKMGL